MSEPLTRALARAADSEAPREDRARAAAEIVRDARGYRWVGIYDVSDEDAVLIAHAGNAPAEHPRFAEPQGLTGEAVRTRATAVGKAEIVVPVLGAESGIVIGTLSVESERANALSADDVAFVEGCAAVLRPLYD
jgi:putative methionine-R-sulfoxide reductase with GAF domain